MDFKFIVKNVSSIFNILLVFSGIYIVGLGIAVELKAVAAKETCEYFNVSVVPIVTIIVGSLLFVLALIGFFGAIRENHLMLTSCGIIMIVLMVLKIAVAVLILNTIDDFVRNISYCLFDIAFPGPEFIIIERTFSCCGLHGTYSYHRENMSLPDRCCARAPCTDENSFSDCPANVQESFTALTANTGITAITVAAVEFVAIASSLCYANIVRKKSKNGFIDLNEGTDYNYVSIKS